MRRRFAVAALIYALAVIYASVVIGPTGFNFVPRDPDEAWRALLAIRFVANGSDQRADWMSNLTMLVPLGFLLTGVFWTQRPGTRHWVGTGLAFSWCLGFIVAVKYAQLFFPPRTVTLNYVFAQGIGSVVGIGLFWTFRQTLFVSRGTAHDRGRRALKIVLRAYAIGLFLYWLFPFDFVLSAGDLGYRVTGLPELMLSWPGEGRSTGIRLILVLAGAAATIPLGMMLAVGNQRVSLRRVAVIGLMTMAAVTVATVFVMSATPYLVSIISRTIGIVIGAAAMMQMRHVDYGRVRLLLARLVPVALIPYVLSVLFINDLLSGHWLTIEEAGATLDYRGLLPLWHYYIVSKAHAMQSLAVHVITFAPIGVMISLQNNDRPGSARLAAAIAFVFSSAIEVGRWLKPGLQPDFNDPFIAAASAWFAVHAVPLAWQMAESLSSSNWQLKSSQHAMNRRVG
jgi:VanZ family protein